MTSLLHAIASLGVAAFVLTLPTFVPTENPSVTTSNPSGLDEIRTTDGFSVRASESSATSPVAIRANEAVALARTDTTPTTTEVPYPNMDTPLASGRVRILPVSITEPTQARVMVIPRGSPVTVDRDAQDVVLAVTEAAMEYGVDGSVMLCVAFAESSNRRLAVGRHQELSIFQFLPTTWRANAPRLGYTIEDIFDVTAQSRVTAEMWSRHQEWQWTTWKGCAR